MRDFEVHSVGTTWYLEDRFGREHNSSESCEYIFEQRERHEHCDHEGYIIRPTCEWEDGWIVVLECGFCSRVAKIPMESLEWNLTT